MNEIFDAIIVSLEQNLVIIFVKADMSLLPSVPWCFHVVLRWTARECTKVCKVCMFNGYCNAY